MWEIFQFNYKETIIGTIISHTHTKQSGKLICFIISTSTSNDTTLLLSSEQICSHGVSVNIFWSFHLKLVYQRNSLTTTTTTQHTEGSVCIRWFQNYSLCVYYRTMWHTNTTCHSLKITLASKVKSNMLFVLELAAISSLFFFSVIILPLQEASLFLPRGNRKDVKKNINQEVYVVSHIICKSHCSRQLQNWRSRIYYSLLSATNKTKCN